MNVFRQVIRGLAPAEPPRPQYYRVPCPRGHLVQGQRTPGYQALRCPTCGEGVFVLPRSPLPEPPEGPRRARARAAGPAPIVDEGPIPLMDAPAGVDVVDRIDAEVEWEEPEPDQADDTPTPAAETPRPKPRTRPAARHEPEVEEQDDADDDEPEVDERPAARRPRKPLVIFLAVATLVVGVVALKVRQQRRQDLPKVVEVGRTLGIEALDQGRFDEAKDLLTKAARAADALGGEVEGADDVRDGAREAAIYADLVPETLESILEEAATAPSEEVPDLFRRRYRGRSIVVDAVVKDHSDGGDALDYVILAPGPTVARRGHIDVTGFALFERARPAPGRPFVFGARLAGMEHRGDEWWFQLEPDSGVILGAKHPAALDALGMATNDEPAAGGAP